MSEVAFMDRLLAGEVLDLDEIDHDIARWHQLPSAPVELHQWLGLTPEEYGIFVEQPGSLRLIAHARRYNIPLQALLRGNEEPAEALAARGASPTEVVELRQWLKRTGRL